jgi:hypothetical protein
MIITATLSEHEIGRQWYGIDPVWVLLVLHFVLSGWAPTNYSLIFWAGINVAFTTPNSFCDTFSMIAKGSYTNTWIGVPHSHGTVFASGNEHITILIEVQRLPTERHYPFGMTLEWHQIVILLSIHSHKTGLITKSKFRAVGWPT